MLSKIGFKKGFYVVACLFFLPGLLFSDGAPFEVLELDLKARVKLSFPADIDGDFKDEIVTVTRQGVYPDYEMKMSAFDVGSAGRIAADKIFEIPVPDRFVFLDRGRFYAEKSDSVFAMAEDGIYVLSRGKTGRSFVRIVASSGLAGPSENGGITYFDFVRDFDGDGADEMIFPEKKGVSLWRGSGAGYEKAAFFDVAPKYFYRSGYRDLPFEMKYGFRGSFWLPQIISADFNGDGNRDVLFLWMDELHAFYGDPEGRFSNGAGHYNFAKLTEPERDGRDAYVIYSIEDLDGDGIADLLMNKFKGQLTSLKSLMEITFRKDPKSQRGEKIILKPQGRIGQGGIVKDVNGDGRKDLIIASGSFNVFSIIKALLKGKLDIKFSFYLFDAGARYKNKPDYSRTLTFAWDLKNTQIEGILPTLEGDFNGDGLPDAFFAPKTGEVRVMLNENGKFYSLGDVIRQEIKSSQDFFFADLDGNGKTDIVFYYSKGPDTEKARILLNRM